MSIEEFKKAMKGVSVHHSIKAIKRKDNDYSCIVYNKGTGNVELTFQLDLEDKLAYDIRAVGMPLTTLSDYLHKLAKLLGHYLGE